MASSSSVVVAAAVLRRRAASYKYPAFLCSPYKPMNILLNDKKWTSSSSSRRSPFGYHKNLRSICTTSTSSSSGCSGIILNKDLQDYYTKSICKEEFEVGSRLVSFTMAINNKKLDLSSYPRTRFFGIRVESIPNGEVVMDMEKTKIVTIAEAVESTGGQFTIRGKQPDLEVSYQEHEFIYAQMDTHSEKNFPSHTLMRRPSAKDIIDCSIRHLFPVDYYNHDTVYATTDVLESDGQQDPIIMAANTTSAALTVSGIQWGGPIGVVRIGRIRGSGTFVVNPTMDQIISGEGLDLNLVYACTRDETLMVELEACEVSTRDVEAALRVAHNEAVKYLEPQIRLAERAWTQKKDYELYMRSDKTKRMVFENILEFENIIKRLGLGKRIRPSKEAIRPSKEAMKNVNQSMMIEKGLRVDGGRFELDTEPLYCESGALPVYYGSSLFCLGRTQVLCFVELRNSSDADYSSDDDEDIREMYSRRTKFHCERAFTESPYDDKKAFLAVLPHEDDFPHNVRAFTKVISSGDRFSSYMASVCGASLALMDAGIPLKRHVAGVSMGLVRDIDPSTGMIKEYRVLTDIDDHDIKIEHMDLKIAGTRKGVTAIHFGKRKTWLAGTRAEIGFGIPLDIICECLEPAAKAHVKVLEHMEQKIESPRRSTPNFIQNGWNWRTLNAYCCFSSAYNEGVYSMDSLRSLQLIGPAPTDDDQALRTCSRDEKPISSSTIHDAKHYQTVLMSSKEKWLAKSTRDVIGSGIRKGVVCLIREENGVFVEVGDQIGFLPISEILLHYKDDNEQKKMISDWVSVGQYLSVTCIGYDTRGFLKLSLDKTRIPAPK